MNKGRAAFTLQVDDDFVIVIVCVFYTTQRQHIRRFCVCQRTETINKHSSCDAWSKLRQKQEAITTNTETFHYQYATNNTLRGKHTFRTSYVSNTVVQYAFGCQTQICA